MVHSTPSSVVIFYGLAQGSKPSPPIRLSDQSSMIPALLFVVALVLYFVCPILWRRAVRPERSVALGHWERLTYRVVLRAQWREIFTTAGLVLRTLKSQHAVIFE